MRSSNIPYLGELDQLRGLAALWIAAYHCNALLGHEMLFGRSFEAEGAGFFPTTWNPLVIVIGQGHTAVALFMVLSGFIFAYGAYGRDIAYGAFIRNRLFRIYPLFLTLLVLSILTTSQSVSVRAIVLTVLPVGWMKYFVPWTPYSAMFWLVSVVCQLYLIFPFIFSAAARRGYYRVPILFVVALVLLRLLALEFGANARDISYFTILGRLDEFLLGMVAGFAYAQRVIPEPMLRRAFLPTSLVILAAICCYSLLLGGWGNPAWWKVLQPPVEGALWAAFVLTYLETAKILPKLFARPLEWTGIISYSIFLLHISVIWLIGTKGLYLRPGLGFYGDLTVNFLLLVLPAILLLASITYLVIEAPFLKLRKPYVWDPPKGAGPREKEIPVTRIGALGKTSKAQIRV